MKNQSDAIENVINLFASLPSIGRKTAQRLTFHLLKQNDEFINKFAHSLVELKVKVKLCSTCFNYTDSDPCSYCSSLKRNRKIILVVEQPNDVVAIEKTNEFNGLYHVLHGVLNPLENISPVDLKVKELVSRLLEVDEVILALNPSLEGEITSQYLLKILNTLHVKVTKIASGIPMGASLEFSDEATLSKAIEGRVNMN